MRDGPLAFRAEPPQAKEGTTTQDAGRNHVSYSSLYRMELRVWKEQHELFQLS